MSFSMKASAAPGSIVLRWIGYATARGAANSMPSLSCHPIDLLATTLINGCSLKSSQSSTRD
jgi:hypothetical protein